MALVKLNKRGGGDLASLHHEMDDLFNTFFGGWPNYEDGVWPLMDISEGEDAIEVKAEVPGCKAEDIDIFVQSNVMSITGEKKKEKGYYWLERSYGRFRRQIKLPADVNTSKVEASCSNGVLTITVPKAETAKAVKVKVKNS